MTEIELKQPVVANDETDKNEEFYDLTKEKSSVYKCQLPPVSYTHLRAHET